MRAPGFVTALFVLLAAGCVAESIPELRGVVQLMRLTPAVWQGSEVWRLVTYGVVGWGGIAPGTLVQLMIGYWLSMQVVVFVGVDRAKVVLFGGIAVVGVCACAAQLAGDALGAPPCYGAPFTMMQGHRTVLAISLASFSACNRHATMLRTPFGLGLPLPVRWLVPLQLLLAGLGYVSTHDLGGAAGIVAATAWGLHVGRDRD